MSSSTVLRIATKVEVFSKICIDVAVMSVLIAVDFLADSQEAKTARQANKSASQLASQAARRPAEIWRNSLVLLVVT